jgi:hypothetical protein
MIADYERIYQSLLNGSREHRAENGTHAARSSSGLCGDADSCVPWRRALRGHVRCYTSATRRHAPAGGE